MQEPSQGDAPPALPHLEYYPVPSSRPSQRVVLDDFPFLIGRGIQCNFVLNSTQVSKKHSVIERGERGLVIRDLGSTNGTFVNGKQVTESPLVHDDVVHVASEEFRFVAPSLPAPYDSVQMRTVPAMNSAPSSIILSNRHLQELLAREAVRVIFQPIVCLKTREPLGYEALARGTHDDLTIKPFELLQLADQCGLASALSQMFRQVATEDAARLPEGKFLFVNLHPAELSDDTLLDSLRDLRARLKPSRPVVVEVPETAVTDVATIRALRDCLRELGFSMAYDDFGAGQTRFMELAEVPPDFIKLDMQLIRNLHLSNSRQNLIGAVNRVAAELHVGIIAEGVETREEAQVCHDLGCHFGQGYWFGRPSCVGLLHQSPDTARDIQLAPLIAQLAAHPRSR